MRALVKWELYIITNDKIQLLGAACVLVLYQLLLPGSIDWLLPIGAAVLTVAQVRNRGWERAPLLLPVSRWMVVGAKYLTGGLLILIALAVVAARRALMGGAGIPLGEIAGMSMVVLAVACVLLFLQRKPGTATSISVSVGVFAGGFTILGKGRVGPLKMLAIGAAALAVSFLLSCTVYARRDLT